MQARNLYFIFLIAPSFQGVNRLFVFSFADGAKRTSYRRYFLPAVEIKYCNVIIDSRNIFDNLVVKDRRT